MFPLPESQIRVVFWSFVDFESQLEIESKTARKPHWKGGICGGVSEGRWVVAEKVTRTDALFVLVIGKDKG